MSGGWFIAGTDTGVGKTRIAQMLLTALAIQGQRAIGMKPVASGCRQSLSGLRHEDAERLLASSGVTTDYIDVNPYAFEPAVAPNLAAQAAGLEIRLETILDHFERLRRLAPWVVVEGVGGWLTPLGPRLTMADVVQSLRLPVILVVGMRLGCLNHALLTIEAIRHRGLTLVGWVANQIDPDMAMAEGNISTLRERIEAPWLASFPYLEANTNSIPLPVFPLGRLGLEGR
jgi:dethiobiotin synthetase